MSKEELLFCPLGGSGEIGGNMNLYAYGKENNKKWIIVDMGVSFADDSVPGILRHSKLIISELLSGCCEENEYNGSATVSQFSIF